MLTSEERDALIKAARELRDDSLNMPAVAVTCLRLAAEQLPTKVTGENNFYAKAREHYRRPRVWEELDIEQPLGNRTASFNNAVHVLLKQVKPIRVVLGNGQAFVVKFKGGGRAQLRFELLPRSKPTKPARGPGRGRVERRSLKEEFFGTENIAQVLPDVRFCHFPHVKLMDDGAGQRDAISLTPEPGTVKLAPPLWGDEANDVKAFIDEIVRRHKYQTRETYWDALFNPKSELKLFDPKCPFVEKDDLTVGKEGEEKRWEENLQTLNWLRNDRAAGLREVRMRNIENLLLTNTHPQRKRPEATPVWMEWSNEKGVEHNHLGWNGGNLFLLSFRVPRRDSLDYQFRFVKSDYYTYRCVADCSVPIWTKISTEVGETEDDLLKYLANPHIVHGGSGVLVVACTSDDKLVIRRRSEYCANYRDANKLAASANEGLRTSGPDTDIKPDGTMKPCIEIVKRALRNELLGSDDDKDDKNRDKAIRIAELLRSMRCYLTGVLLYRPNLTINLCFLVHLDAAFEEVEELAAEAAHTDEFTETIGTPYNRGEFCEFIASTRQPSTDGGIFTNSWCEGSLLPYYLALWGKK